MRSFLRDVRYAARVLRKSPGFTAVAVLTLTLGIGANTAVFSLVDAALLRSLPVRDPQTLVVFKWTAQHKPKHFNFYDYLPCPSGGNPAPLHGCTFSYPLYEQYKSLNGVFSGVSGLGGDVGVELRGNGPTSLVRGELVSGDFFETAGVEAALGRTLEESDDKPGAPGVAVLGYGYWQRAFGGDPKAIGRTVWLNNLPVTIVGVATQGFPSLDPSESRSLWAPISLEEELGKNMSGSSSGSSPSLKAGEDNWWVYVVARLKPGVSLSQAQTAADVLYRNAVLHRTPPLFAEADAPRIVLMRAPDAMTGLRERYSRALATLGAIVGIVLLIACANVGGLMLARSAARRKEMAVRLALGAGRMRVARQLLTESLLISAAGAVCGILVGYWSAQAILAMMSRGGRWPSHVAAQLDWRVLLFTALITVLTGVLFGIAPALRGARIDLTPALKESAGIQQGEGSRRRWWNLGSSLVVAQVGLSIVVLAGAGLMVRTLENLEGINPGFDARDVLLFGIDPTLNGYTEAQTRSLYSELQERIGALPGVASVSYSFDPLLSGDLWSTSFGIEGEKQTAEDMTDALHVGPGFFETMQIPILLGRAMNEADFDTAAKSGYVPLVVNQEFVRRFLKDQRPLGLHIGGFGRNDEEGEIVGVARDAKYPSLRSGPRPTMYVPQMAESTTFEVRTKTSPSEMVPAIRSAVSEVDNNLPIYAVRTQSQVIDGWFFEARLIARLSGLFGLLSLALACVGLYGLLSYEVTRRTREIGVRTALGAQPRDILGFVLIHGVGLTVVGLIAGIFAAIGVTRYLGSFLYGVKPADPLTFFAVAILLVLVALGASYLPAKRATSVDPMVALRYE